MVMLSVCKDKEKNRTPCDIGVITGRVFFFFFLDSNNSNIYPNGECAVSHSAIINYSILEYRKAGTFFGHIIEDTLATV